MPTRIEKDAVTGVETTGHEWDGIKELNNPLPPLVAARLLCLHRLRRGLVGALSLLALGARLLARAPRLQSADRSRSADGGGREGPGRLAEQDPGRQRRDDRQGSRAAGLRDRGRRRSPSRTIARPATASAAPARRAIRRWRTTAGSGAARCRTSSSRSVTASATARIRRHATSHAGLRRHRHPDVRADRGRHAVRAVADQARHRPGGGRARAPSCSRTTVSSAMARAAWGTRSSARPRSTARSGSTAAHPMPSPLRSTSRSSA